MEYSKHSLFMSLTIVLVFLLVSPSCGTSRQLQEKKSIGIRAELKHVDSGKNMTKFERIRQGMKRGHHRLQKLRAMVLASGDSQLTAPIHAGNGEFLMELSIGTPPSSYSAIVDTGSDLIWTQCKPCTQCFDQPTPIFDPKKSKSFTKLPCENSLCKALPESSCSDGCEYLYTYGDYSSTQGRMASETFTFKSSDSKNVQIPKIGFGCGDDNEGDGFQQGAGLVGLGRGPLSLISQLKESKFAYCMASIDDGNKTSPLFMGSLLPASLNKSNSVLKTTPLVQNPSQPSFYYLSLEGISLGGTRLKSIDKTTFALQDDGSGGLIIDSGTTITYLDNSAFQEVKKEFTSQVDLPLDDSGAAGLDVCFKLPSESTEVKVPKFVFHFEGADLDLPGDNYMISDSSLGLLCLAMASSSGMSILGNVQQQNMLVVHDLQKETLSFQHTKCDQL
ncbi:aspartic proteinase nepenthesin-1 [Rutidosis leptorrhynchoides]|uniref:aspartic proteinase nepenthesin-1 n=1 Tax=Rutidosis leptorrhynchoides TaxID=125765 RepID=UPI003A9A59A8